MKKIPKWLPIAVGMLSLAPDWKRAQPGWQYAFPRDHYSHKEFKTEWWYFTGNLFDSTGNRFGYELTFFRQGIRPPAERDPALSRFIVNDLQFAHFTLTDVAGKRFRFDQQTSRGTFGESGFDDDQRIAWLKTWAVRISADGSFDLSADSPAAAVRLHLKANKPPAIHGQNGISAKASGDHHASHYYSISRLETMGEVKSENNVHVVRGESWFDHEWATNQLAANQAGWNWLCLQFDDGTELMLYQMRLENGGIDSVSSGTFIAADGATTFLPNTAFEMTPTDFWMSKKKGAHYPIGWNVAITGLNLEFSVKATLRDQELTLVPLTYWEGAVDAIGVRGGRKITARGYLELTGYAGELRELQR